MATIDFPVLFNDLKNGVVELAKSTFTEYADIAVKEAQNILKELKTEIKQWAEDVASGEMDIKDVEDLVKGRKSLLQMKVLQQKGMAQIQIDKFRNGLVDLVVKAVSKVL